MGIFESFVIAVGINMLLFIPAFLLKTDKLTDISYGLSFILVAGIILITNESTLSKTILFLMITLWAIRIGAYLLIRIWKIGRDKRFDDKRDNFVKFGAFWFLQGITVFFVLLASTQYFTLEQTTITQLSLLGLLVWATGLLVETHADFQKYAFINDPSNKGKWIDRGLWKYSRHPNYFGEMLVWIGIYIYTLPALSGISYFIGLVSPLYISLLIIFISGIPLLEKAADKRWSDNPEYLKYKKKTSVLVPFPPKEV